MVQRGLAWYREVWHGTEWYVGLNLAFGPQQGNEL